MREIEFRGFTTEKGEQKLIIKGKEYQGEWIYGYIFKAQCGAYYIVDTNNDGEDGIDVRMRLVVKETVGQYIGLKDKKRTKIFEGGIVEVKNCETFVIKYQHNEFRFIPICNAHTFLQAHEYKESDFEVIGNIYDNKELLYMITKN